jgi:hypothetical protein
MTFDQRIFVQILHFFTEDIMTVRKCRHVELPESADGTDDSGP